MTEAGDESSATGPVRVGTAILLGNDDRRVRATWRVLLAYPLFWVVAGGVLAGNGTALVAPVVAGTIGPGLLQSLLHATFLVALLVPWARVVERRPLSAFGYSGSLPWALDFLVGFVAVVVGFAVWIGTWSTLGETTAAVSLSNPRGALLPGLLVLAVALLLHAAAQQVVFFRIVVENGAEGLHSRDLTPRLALAVAAVVAVPIFVAMHGFPSGLRLLDLAVVGGIYALLFVHTGELALGTGTHFGALFVGSAVFRGAASGTSGPTVFEVSWSLPGALDALAGYGFPVMVVAYCLSVAWLRWRRGEVSFRGAIPQVADA